MSYNDDVKDVRKGIWGWSLWFVLFFVVMSLFGTAIYVLSTGSRVLTRTLETDNVLARYEEFYDLCVAVKSHDATIVAQTERLSLETEPSVQSRVRANIAGVKALRASDVAKYNANSAKLTAQYFKDWRLPDTIGTEQVTSCGK